MTDEGKSNEQPLSEEDKKTIEKEMKDMEDKLVSEATQKKIKEAADKAKEEAKIELEKEQRFKELEKEKEELRKSIEDKEKLAAEELAKMKAKVDELISSKAPVKNSDPFAKRQDKNDSNNIENWSQEKVDSIEEASARAFFGKDYDDR